MNYGDYKYIWHAPDWPKWRCDLATLARPMAEVSRAQGVLIGRLADVGAVLRDRASLVVLTEDVVKTSEIEGEQLNVASVRSSIARRLGVDIGALAPIDRHVEGVVEMVLDATANCHAPVSWERLFAWHAALFPTGYAGLSEGLEALGFDASVYSSVHVNSRNFTYFFVADFGFRPMNTQGTDMALIIRREPFAKALDPWEAEIKTPNT